jgi:PhoPQ-activated pathogenicity-related protein
MKKLVLAAMLLLGAMELLRATPLEDYVHAPDTNFAWRVLEMGQHDGFTVTRIGFISQEWQGGLWTNFIWIVQPPKLRNPQYAALIIGGDQGTNMLREATNAAWHAGAWVVALSRVPNQPLYGGLKEDDLVAYTFDQYLKTGDDTWPLLLPMVKSAVRAMDLTQLWLKSQQLPAPEKFVVTGASKRGWMTWLTAAVDDRVAAIAPRVFDMLNMKVQTEWAKKVYGHQTEKIQAYTKLGLVDKMDTPGMQRLCGFADPYAYRDRYVMPKLLLLGANDPYWTVDSLRNYWDGLPGPKLVYVAPNTGHALARDSQNSFAAFFELIADGHALPEMSWEMNGNGHPRVKVTFDQPVKAARLWTAAAATRDFRQAKWASQPMLLVPGVQAVSASVAPPARGYLAFMVELTFASAGGDYKLSTPVQVTPDDIRLP